ncbi:hypothetical protein ACFSCW_02890 [Sphingomonas tabacisoli]|uniref:Uncharacterized protein n=1 Tax=Sphingomonas tabacisoli TaxID=2249466 RepID=A0ABW4I0X3_9SPHN
MIQVFVFANDKNGDEAVAETYEFISIPRIGEEVIIDQEKEQKLLRVTGVTNVSRPSGDFMEPLTYVHLHCEIIG